jgi:hypothetical protein
VAELIGFTRIPTIPVIKVNPELQCANLGNTGSGTAHEKLVNPKLQLGQHGSGNLGNTGSGTAHMMIQKNWLHFSICACHPCAGAMLIFSVSFQF